MYLDDVDVRYRALVDVAGALTSHSDHTDLLRSLRGHLEPIVQFTFLSVWLWNRDADRLTVAFVEPTGAPGARLVGESYPAAGTYPGQAVQTGHPVYVSDVDPGGPSPSQVMVEHGVQSYCAVPLVTAHGTIGTLNFGSLDRDAYTTEDIELMSRVGALVAVALENARSVETIRDQQAALRRERDQLDLLLEVTNAIVTQLDTRALFLALAPALQAGLQRRVRGAHALRPGRRACCASTCARARPSCAGIGPPTDVETPVDASLAGHGLPDAASRASSPATSCSRYPGDAPAGRVRRALGLLGAAAHAARAARHARSRRRSIATRSRRRCSAC